MLVGRAQSEALVSRHANFAARFRAAMSAKHALPAWADPGVVFTVLYMQCANHFVVEKLIGAEGYLGMRDGVKPMIRNLFRRADPRRPRRAPRRRCITSSG